MMVSRRYLFGLALVSLACARELEQSHGLLRRAQEDIPHAGIGAVRGICDPLVSECASNDMQIKEEIAAVLGSKSHVAAVGSIELGELSCDSLDNVLDSTLLRFTINSNQTVIAERAYFTVMEGDPLTDNKDRKVWIGDVIEPAPPAGSTACTISISWTEPCDVEGFFLKMITRQNDGSTAVLTSMPCAAGTSQEICLVETTEVFKGKGDPKTRKVKSGMSRRSLKDNGDADAASINRNLQGTTQIDVLVLYTPEGMEQLSITSSSAMETVIRASFVEANLGNANSEIPLEYNVVHVVELPYDQEIDSDDMLDSMTHSGEIEALRNEFGADLVHLIGGFDDYCGLAWLFRDDDDTDAYGITSANCLDDLTLGHELGHNMGCNHNRGVIPDNEEEHPYAYGNRYCTGADPYITIMSYTDNCNGGYVNFYSNPDVIHKGRPTGTETENCARRIRETRDTVAAYRQTEGGGCASSGDVCTSTSDCCDSPCISGVCGPCINGQSRGDGTCDAALNTLECGWDDGDCCECSNWAAFIDPDADRTFNCLDPDPQCLDNCPGVYTMDYINDNYCDDEFNNAECRWDGGDCCQFSCELDMSTDCNPPGGEYNCLQGSP